MVNLTSWRTVNLPHMPFGLILLKRWVTGVADKTTHFLGCLNTCFYSAVSCFWMIFVTKCPKVTRQMFSTYLCFKKAFDSVPRTNLLIKLWSPLGMVQILLYKQLILMTVSPILYLCFLGSLKENILITKLY